jgi:hypothetical protein
MRSIKYIMTHLASAVAASKKVDPKKDDSPASDSKYKAIPSL